MGLLYPHEVMVLAVVLTGPAWFFAQKQGVWFLSDYATVIVPFVIWFGLSAAKSGYRGLLNRNELLILAALIPIALSIRVFLLDRWLEAPQRSSFSVFAICALTAVALSWAHRPQQS